jgi:AraC-like DNA-binding protein
MTIDRMHTFQNVYFVPIDYSNSKFEQNYHSPNYLSETVDLLYCRSGLIEVEILGNGDKKTKGTIELSNKQFLLLDTGMEYKFSVKSKEPSVLLTIRWKLTPVRDYEYNAGSLISVDVRGFFDKLEGLKRFTYNSDCYITALDSGNLENSLIRYLRGLVINEEDISREINDLTNFLQMLLELDKSLLPSAISTGIVYIKKAQDYIKNNFHKNVTVDDVAKAAGINKAYLQRLFKAHIGMSVIQSLNNFRIEKCKQLLIDTNLTINEICARAGFNNRQHLIYEFRTQTGTTPTAFRDEFLNRSFIGGVK